MSENLPNKNNTSEEVDLGQLFNAIGKMFDRLFGFIASIFKFLFSIIIFTLKTFITYFVPIVIVLFVAAGIGYGLEKYKPNVYSSEMLVRPYFDSKYQLVNNIGYFNALISSGDYETLATIFELSKEESEKILDFEINFGPETENERIVQYDNFLKSLDSVRALKVDYEEYIDNRSIYSVELYQINVKSLKKDIFPALENGFKKSFTNEYTDNKKKKRDSLIGLQKSNLREQISQIDSLQKVYINVLEGESNAPQAELSLGGEGFSINKDKTATKEYELLDKKISLRNELQDLESKQIEDDVFFDVIASFQKIGNKKKDLKDRYSIIFPAITFVLLFLGFVILKIIKYVRNYDS